LVLDWNYNVHLGEEAKTKLVVVDDKELYEKVFWKSDIPRLNCVHEKLCKYSELIKKLDIKKFTELLHMEVLPTSNTQPKLLKELTQRYSACLSGTMAMSRYLRLLIRLIL
jgi:hypothetical protein